MRFRTGLAWGLLIVCVGCGPSALYDQEVAIELDGIESVIVGPFDKEETLTVALSSPGAPVSVYVFDKEQTEYVDYDITYGKPPRNVLAGEASTESTTVTAQAPAGKEIVVRLQPAGKQAATVQLKITK